jgi:hypothetical protein
MSVTMIDKLEEEVEKLYSWKDAVVDRLPKDQFVITHAERVSVEDDRVVLLRCDFTSSLTSKDIKDVVLAEGENFRNGRFNFAVVDKPMNRIYLLSYPYFLSAL